MSSIQPPGTALPIQQVDNGQVGGTDAVELTPDALMAYLQSKLRGLDDQMNGLMNGQNALNDQQKALANLSGVLKDHTGDQTDPAALQQMKAAYQAALGLFPPGSPDYDQLNQQYQSFVSNAADGKVGGDEMSNFTNAIHDQSQSLSSDAETNMINLQSLMSQRQTAIQMCTNMVNALDQSCQAVAANIGKG
jgi:hypothetical protein